MVREDKKWNGPECKQYCFPACHHIQDRFLIKNLRIKEFSFTCEYEIAFLQSISPTFHLNLNKYAKRMNGKCFSVHFAYQSV